MTRSVPRATDPSRARITVDEVLGFDADDRRQRLAELESSPAFAGIAETITRNFSHLSTAAAVRAIVAKIPELLRVDVESLLVGAWKKYAELQRYRDAATYPPDETVLVELAEHTIRSSHTPYLDIMVGESRLHRIEFQLDLELVIKGAVLTVRDGRIWAVSVGSCEASGELTFKGYSLLKRQSTPVALPGTHTFAAPIPIPALPLPETRTTTSASPQRDESHVGSNG
jgi:hypothetical protein